VQKNLKLADVLIAWKTRYPPGMLDWLDLGPPRQATLEMES